LKELLPVAYLVDDQTSTARPVPVISLSLRALSEAGVERCVVTISDRKPELMRYPGDGADFQLQLAYVQQSTPSGLAVAVSLATDWMRDCYSCMLLPDTIVHPYKAMSSLRQVMDREELDLVLGVFPTEVPEQLGPVRFDADGCVLEVLDKPAATDVRNTWARSLAVRQRMSGLALSMFLRNCSGVRELPASQLNPNRIVTAPATIRPGTRKSCASRSES
jgi:glucose-1-phosphate thymidylyltransferase